MTPVPAAAVKNTNIVAGSEVNMTDEELEQAFKEADEEIAEFGPEKTLANKEWRQQ